MANFPVSTRSVPWGGRILPPREPQQVNPVTTLSGRTMQDGPQRPPRMPLRQDNYRTYPNLPAMNSGDPFGPAPLVDISTTLSGRTMQDGPQRPPKMPLRQDNYRTYPNLPPMNSGDPFGPAPLDDTSTLVSRATLQANAAKPRYTANPPSALSPSNYRPGSLRDTSTMVSPPTQQANAAKPFGPRVLDDTSTTLSPATLQSNAAKPATPQEKNKQLLAAAAQAQTELGVQGPLLSPQAGAAQPPSVNSPLTSSTPTASQSKDFWARQAAERSGIKFKNPETMEVSSTNPFGFKTSGATAEQEAEMAAGRKRIYGDGGDTTDLSGPFGFKNKRNSPELEAESEAGRKRIYGDGNENQPAVRPPVLTNAPERPGGNPGSQYPITATANIPPEGSRSLEQEEALYNIDADRRGRNIRAEYNDPPGQMSQGQRAARKVFADQNFADRTNQRNKYEADRGITPETKLEAYIAKYGMTPKENVERIQRNAREYAQQRKDNIAVFRGSKSGSPANNPYAIAAQERIRRLNLDNSPEAAGAKAKADYMASLPPTNGKNLFGQDVLWTKEQQDAQNRQADAIEAKAKADYSIRKPGRAGMKEVEAAPQGSPLFNEFGVPDYSPENYKRINTLRRLNKDSSGN